MKRTWLALWMAFTWHGLVQAQWQVVSVDGRDYVPLDNIGTFYGMDVPVKVAEKSFTARGGGRELTVTFDTRDVMIDGVKHWLSFPVRDRGGVPHVSRMDVSKTIEPAFRPERIGAQPFTTVVLDAGHGGHDKGASASFGLEKDLTLDMSRRVGAALKKAGLKVVVTRNSDVFVELERRARIANGQASCIFVSLHFNVAGWNPAANGFEVFCITPPGAPPTSAARSTARDASSIPGQAVEPRSFVLANTVQHALLGRMKMADRGVKRERFAVLRYAKVPAILIEGGFFTNAGDAAKIASAAWRDSYADAIVAGILVYKSLAEGKTGMKRLADYRGNKPSVEVAVKAESAGSGN